MKYSFIFCGITFATLLSFKDPEASAQIVSPGFYGGSPVSYYGGDSDDDIGILLAILLLAARNRGNGGGCGGGYCCCNCCNCGNTPRSIPVPYPIPIPTNNPIIRQYHNDEDEDGDTRPIIIDKQQKSSNDPSEVINVSTDNADSSRNTSNSKNDNKSTSKSSSTSNNSSTANNTSNNKDDVTADSSTSNKNRV